MNLTDITITDIIRSDYFSVADKFKFKKYNCADWELAKLIGIKRQEYANRFISVISIFLSFYVNYFR